MKFPLKPVGLLLALMLFFSVLPLTASAAADSYSFRYAPSQLPMAYDDNVPYFYVTPFGMDHTVIRENGTQVYSGSCFPQIFNLINLEKLMDGGEGAYASTPAYCIDASAGIREGTSYRRINLEDSFDGETAGRIRAVVLRSFPYKSITALQARANSWLRRQGLPQIQELQSGEAILAAQAALWKIANGETIHSLYVGMADMTAYLEKTVEADTANQQETSHTARNVESLYTYLCNLSPESPKYDAASEMSLEAPVYSDVKGPDGTYTVTASVTVNTTVGPRDSLTVTASCGDQVQSQSVTEAGKYCFTFRNLPEQLEVNLELQGRQCGGDVYLFDAEGQQASQPLVGYDDSRMNVYGQTTVGTNRVRSLASAGIIVESGAGTGLGVQLDVSGVGCSSGTFAVGESHSWIIRSGIPLSLRSARGYTITGVIDSRLTYEPGSPSVCLYTRAGAPLPLRQEDHYVLEEVDANFFRVSLTPAGMAYVVSNLGSGENSPELHIRFQAAINETASMGERIPNAVHLTYTDAAGNEYEADSGISEVHTGGITLWNTDSENADLPGAVYRLVRVATENERSDPSVETTFLNVGEEIQTVVYVPFYAAADLSGGQVWEVTTSGDGRAALCGLAYGSYYLVQMQPSNGYLLETKPIPVTVNGSSHLPGKTVKICNTKIYLPETGGEGTGLFHLLGVAILGSACFLLFTNRKRRCHK